MRRVHVSALHIGQIELPEAQAHYVRNVLRLPVGTIIEAFDASGARARAEMVAVSSRGVTLRVDQVEPATPGAIHLTVAAAIPKGPRGDWMIEKLGELGTDLFIPLAAQRSVVLPDGAGKPLRWARLAAEAARQSGRPDVMRIEPLTRFDDLLDQVQDTDTAQTWCLATHPDARSILTLTQSLPRSLRLLIGPEGGWSEEEDQAMLARGIVMTRLTQTTLRVETAAIAAAAIVQSAADQNRHQPGLSHRCSGKSE